jgi:hypothetical protein
VVIFLLSLILIKSSMKCRASLVGRGMNPATLPPPAGLNPSISNIPLAVIMTRPSVRFQQEAIRIFWGVVIPVVMSLDRADKTKKWLLSSKERSNDHNHMHLNGEA